MTSNKCLGFHVWMQVSSLPYSFNSKIFSPLRLDVQRRCSACSKSRTIKIHPEKSQSSDLEGKRKAPFQMVQPHPLVIRIKTVRVLVAYLQVNQLLYERLLFFCKRNAISLLTFYLREKTVLRRCLSEKQLNGSLYILKYHSLSLAWARRIVL